MAFSMAAEIERDLISQRTKVDGLTTKTQRLGSEYILSSLRVFVVNKNQDLLKQTQQCLNLFFSVRPS
jgi:hypothetical protein